MANRETICKACPAKIKTTDYLLSIGSSKYCSRKCKDKSQIGRLFSDETKKKISLGGIGKHGMSEKHKKIISDYRRGKKMSNEVRTKISNSKRGITPMREYGQKWSQEARKRAIGSRTGTKNPRWIRDRSKLQKKEIRYNNSSYKNWKKYVAIRDNFRCILENEDCFGKIEFHHIYSWSLFPDLRYDINNGATLCHKHHPRGRRKEEEDRVLLLNIIKFK